MDRTFDVIIASTLPFGIKSGSSGPVLSGRDRPDLRPSFESRLFRFRTRDELDKTRGVAPFIIGQFLFLTPIEGLSQFFRMLCGDHALSGKGCILGSLLSN